MRTAIDILLWAAVAILGIGCFITLGMVTIMTIVVFKKKGKR